MEGLIYLGAALVAVLCLPVYVYVLVKLARTAYLNATKKFEQQQESRG